MLLIKFVCIQIFMFVGVWVIKILEFNRKKKKRKNKTVKYHITSITWIFQDFADFFSISLVFDMFFTLVLVEVKLIGMWK